jgi:hypothetical protein
MQFILHAAADTSHLAAIENAIAALDPAVMLDADTSGYGIRISTVVTEDELISCLRKAGLEPEPQQLNRVPSECCGGCGG